MPIRATCPSLLVVIPCLNEAANIGRLLRHLRPAALRLRATIAVVDGGSVDGTWAIMKEIAAIQPEIILLHNKRRIQSAAVNLAVRMLGQDCEYLIRLDAHCAYPDDYLDVLLDEALATGADSVVVSMTTAGQGLLQEATAAAQNSRLGNGGSPHRNPTRGCWIDHGHHALMRMAAFRHVGGYDETFSHNEDAELDYSLRKAGYRIWLTGRTGAKYQPRSSFRPLFLQYLAYGRGRARTILKHRIVPKLRQAMPLMVLPGVLLGLLSFIHWVAVLPLVTWMSVCFGFGLWMAVREGKPHLVLGGLSAMVMHVAWSIGFWLQLAAGLLDVEESVT